VQKDGKVYVKPAKSAAKRCGQKLAMVQKKRRKEVTVDDAAIKGYASGQFESALCVSHTKLLISQNFDQTHPMWDIVCEVVKSNTN
jgi:hypothetical protein